MTATPNPPASSAPKRGWAVGRQLALYAVAATFVVAAVIGAGRYGWLLLHTSNNFLDDLESGWQVTLGEVAIGCVIVVVGLLAGYLARRIGRSLANRTPHTRAVRFASLLPGLLLGVAVLRPVNATLTWASDHTSQAATDRADAARFLADVHRDLLAERKAPLRVRTQAPAAPAAVAHRLLSATRLGTGWYSLQTPTVSVAPVVTKLQDQGASSAARTAVAKATRIATGWQLNIYVDEHATTFRTTSEAGRYARNFRQESSKVATTTIDGIAVHSWLETTDTSSHPEAAFNVGKAAYTIFADGFAGKELVTADIRSLLRAAVRAAKS